MDLTTTYMGLTLEHPLVPSASPWTGTVEGVERLVEAGASAVVLHSLFEEQVRFEVEGLDHFLEHGTYRFAEALTYYPPQASYHLERDRYLDLIRRAKAAVDVPVIASLNGVSAGGWVNYATEIEQAGADALELNVYFLPTDPGVTGSEVENLHVATLQAVKMAVNLPVAMKLSPYFSATAAMLRRLDTAGADGLVLFNRFYQPVIDIEALEVQPDLVLSSSQESRLPVRWVAIMYGKVRASLAVTSGIGTPEGVVQALMAGADVAQVCSAVLREGPSKVTDLVAGLGRWLEAHRYQSVAEVKGILSQRKVAEPAAFERANYVKTLSSYTWPGSERVS